MENCLERIWNLVSEDAGLGSIILSHQPDKLSEPWSINWGIYVTVLMMTQSMEPFLTTGWPGAYGTDITNTIAVPCLPCSECGHVTDTKSVLSVVRSIVYRPHRVHMLSPNPQYPEWDLIWS